MIPLPINPPVRWAGHGTGRWIVLGACQDRVGGNVWIVKAVASAGGGWRPDWNGGQRAARITDLAVAEKKVPKKTRTRVTRP